MNTITLKAETAESQDRIAFPGMKLRRSNLLIETVEFPKNILSIVKTRCVKKSGNAIQ